MQMMNCLPYALILAVGLTPVFGQDSAVPNPDTTGQTATVAPVADGDEPTPEQAKPRLVVSEGDVLQTWNVVIGTQTVSFQKLRPLTLPVIPEPAMVETEPEKTEALRQAAREYAKKRRFVFVGATVYVPDNDPDKAVSLVRFWPNAGGEAVTMWVNANMLWLCGTAEFKTDEMVYSLMMMCSEFDIERRKRIAGMSKFAWQAPEFPEFPNGDITYLVVDGTPAADDLKPFDSFLELYRNDRTRLRRDYEMRKLEAERERLERLAAPPDVKAINIRYWRLDEAGNDGVEPKPAVIR